MTQFIFLSGLDSIHMNLARKVQSFPFNDIIRVAQLRITSKRLNLSRVNWNLLEKKRMNLRICWLSNCSRCIRSWEVWIWKPLVACTLPWEIDRIYPRGRGEVEVAVSGILDQSKEGSSPSSPSSNRGFGFGTIVRRAASIASMAAKHAYAAIAATRGPDDDMLPLKCCLMSMLPSEDIAHNLLFKGSPPVNL
ncbi:uncharacterized protein LOC130787619 [Actinidia eriantha]|uniref:uncharacterized protein LOC130787619 n=1 Tax=Actinidia eriantha TaxID=165200 RepID=UPI00258DB45C|nr:uncharacterized protein LOC130787619 [Actinidia eriantha]XP_057503993.1 uncharacterized protein LOC130787619 [Actinidia eriantha]XP_057503994.1 uncharacterized protein LOC130787619 [Actinidia eriantha]XP_057503995.1 uncharacterized protein LOC130787619 [Actinidia eriantha]XP_057503996.1 uncharacterized protein LOC130787619 [Actinidia eriantha]XP_057503997.1 uncharacterized protein LOC130787619 [Actinidia eriantha]XP_057503998.1 uncharacterized protein LOC130787619 [Actinidia eriantha]XP_0